MALLAIFCTNAINIYAGVNGLEAGQALVIALAALAHNAIEVGAGSSASAGHALSATLLMPLAAVTLALLRYNWYVLALHAVLLDPSAPAIASPPAFLLPRYPAQVFVGDTFCYFSGMAFAVVAIQGHFSKTLLLLLLPQLANFAYVERTRCCTSLLRCRAAARHHDCAAPRVLHYYCAITTLLLLLVTS